MVSVTIYMFLATISGSPGPERPSAIPKKSAQVARYVVHAVGIGYPPRRMRGAQARLMARRAAEVRALRNLAMELGLGSRAIVRGYRVMSTTRRADGSYRVVVQYPGH